MVAGLGIRLQICRFPLSASWRGSWEKHALTSILSEAPFTVLQPLQLVAPGLEVHF